MEGEYLAPISRVCGERNHTIKHVDKVLEYCTSQKVDNPDGTLQWTLVRKSAIKYRKKMKKYMQISSPT